ncbi:E3 ubiquitin-protein ligase TRIM11-like [Lethenteron reissneri]|uniref:E3 ubiquitin-protein ligase TRIM11-like n=1 Tax=Lethenteron reissneri TaxID=7753 RepID=UPI002AB6C088|nr:E3 ubiquitin-protein ligase TRIM11-like [Lethenteron reissneri]
MASTTPSESVDSELRCSICLDTFVCPSTLSCGHSFCLRCLAAAWETASSFSCPQCRATFLVQPQLRKNEALANLAEQFRIGDGMATAVVCDICGDGQTPAVKTCLRCEMSYCFSHFRTHVENPRLREHAVVDPTASLDERKCPHHSEELNFYCTVDSSLVCSSCTIAVEHKGHKVLTLKDEHERRKTRVGEETRVVEEKRKEAEESVKRMEAARKEAQDIITETKVRISDHFSRMRAVVDEDEREALRRVEVKGRELLSRIEEDIARHEREIGELQAAAARLRALQHERDSLAFLQVHMKETLRGNQRGASRSGSSHDSTTVIRALEGTVVKLLAFMHGRSPTLDTNSAYNRLQISSDLRTVTVGGVPQGRPHHPHRFDCWSQALCFESFSSGQHYWVVDVGSAGLCWIGVTYRTIPRSGRGADCGLGGSDVSWCLQKAGKSLSVRHGGVETSLSVPEPPRRVGVHLDWDAGLLSFYSADSMTLLHSFHQTFTHPLYPGLLMGSKVGDSVRIVDLCGAS